MVLGAGYFSVTLPLKVQLYFIERPNHLDALFREAENSEGETIFSIMRKWAKKRKDLRPSVRAAIAQTQFVLRIGLGTLLVFGFAFVSLYAAFITLLVWNLAGPPFGALAFTGAALMIVGVMMRFWRKGQPREKQGDSNPDNLD